MTREEAMKIIESNRVYYRDFKHEEFNKALDRLKQPLTFAEFLGWEEGEEYKCDIYTLNILKVEDNMIFAKGEKSSSGWCRFNLFAYELFDLRNATKYEPKFYAKVKGWELISSTYCHFGLDDFSELEVVDRVDGYRLSKAEWAELGITDKNADFEEVEE